jgi:hypothetical protein
MASLDLSEKLKPYHTSTMFSIWEVKTLHSLKSSHILSLFP